MAAGVAFSEKEMCMLLRTTDVKSRFQDRLWLEQTGTILLVAAGLVVAVAIAASGALARGTNGIAGVLWISAAAMLIAGQRDDRRFRSRLLIVAAIGLGLVLVVKPSDMAWAIAGFGIAGIAIGVMFNERGVAWAKVLAALWLPEHLGTAAGKAIYRAIRDLPASVRTEPPPTTAFVPLAMILAAWFGALLVAKVRARS